jgi:hypothetical protein
MKITVIRKEYTAKSTIGELYVDGKFECYTLEDHILTRTCAGTITIPSGHYEVVVTLVAHPVSKQIDASD